MNPIGGYFGLELGNGPDQHPGAIGLGLGRHAVEYLVRARGLRRIHMPRFTCDVFAPVLERCGVGTSFYDVDMHLDPEFDTGALGPGEALLYTNYFGLKDATIKRLAERTSALIIDNAQAYYRAPLPGIDTFYSPRKFFGVTDGGFLYTTAPTLPDLPLDRSSGRYEHLLVAVDQGVEAGYAMFQRNESEADRHALCRMSNLTRRVLQGLDHAAIVQRRRANRDRLHAALGGLNRLAIDPSAAEVPFTYPFMTDDGGLRQRLLDARVYTATYWPRTLAPLMAGSPAARLVDRLVHLPVDQRWDDTDMDRIIAIVLGP